MDTRLLGKPSDFSGARDAWREWSTVFEGYAGAAIPRLQKLMDDAAKAAAPIPNATIMDENDRAVSTRMMPHDLHKGTALNIVFRGRRQRTVSKLGDNCQRSTSRR